MAPYAQLSAESRGRAHPEEPSEHRTHYHRDRDRIIHSRAFRRLEYKTQVFLNGTGDHLRTRLTHTIEVAAITRNIARALRINEDLAETIALAHDLGHSPFGHKGEAVLDRLMQGEGGFEHNRHSLRIVEQLEQKYPGFSGLNLTWEVREGLAKHVTSYDAPGVNRDFSHRSPSLEAQVANVADEVAYYSHDLDDGLESELLTEEELRQNVILWERATDGVCKSYGQLPEENRRQFTIRCLIDEQVRDVIQTTEQSIAEAGVGSADAVRALASHLVGFNPQRRHLNNELRDYLFSNLYYNPVVHEPNLRAVNMLEALFHFYLEHPEEMGEQARRRAPEAGWRRTVCDYLAGMTDRYVMTEHARLIGE